MTLCSSFVTSLRAAGLVALAAIPGCAANVKGAVQVGNHEAATWVYISSEEEARNGVYRCWVHEDVPRCVRASMMK